MTFGITPNGFVQKQTSDIIASMALRLQGAFGATVATNLLSSGIANLNNVFAQELALAWQLGQDVYSSQYPNGASGQSLANIGLITGVQPLLATQSSVIEVLVGTNGTVAPNTTLLSTSTSAIFQQVAAATIATLPAWVGATLYTGQSGVGPNFTIGSLVTNGGNIYYCVQSGTSGAGPSGTGNNIADGGCLWNYVAAGSAAVATLYKSTLFQPVVGNAGTITTVSTPVGGLSSVTNPLSATLGTLPESDIAFRIRRASLLRSSGNGTIAAITARLLAVSGVTNAVVINNPNPFVVNGQPANSFAPYVLGGATQDILNAIVQADPAGIQSFGSTSGNGVDVAGNNQPAAFSVATQTNIYVAVTLTSGSTYSGNASVKSAIAAYGNATWGTNFGAKIIANLLYNSGYFGFGANFPVAGVTEITALNIGTAPSPGSSADIQVGATAIAAFDASRITVNGA